MSTPVPRLLDWPLVRAIPYRFAREGCAWITDASIEDCFKRGHLEDVSIPQDEHSHHASRVASCIQLLREGVTLDPIDIRIDSKIWIADGSHRLRAYQYLGMDGAIPALVSGHLGVLKRAYVNLADEDDSMLFGVHTYKQGFSWWVEVAGGIRQGHAKTRIEGWYKLLKAAVRLRLSTTHCALCKIVGPPVG